LADWFFFGLAGLAGWLWLAGWLAGWAGWLAGLVDRLAWFVWLTLLFKNSSFKHSTTPNKKKTAFNKL